MATDNLSENNPKEDNSKKEKLLNFVYERENYAHSIIWKAENFFAVLVSGLIATAISVFSVSLSATFIVVVIAFAMSLLGDYVLRKESKYFIEYRYARIKLQKDLHYHEGYEDVINEFSGKLPCKDKYVGEWAMPKTGVRRAFTMVYLLQSILCILVVFVISLQLLNNLIPANWVIPNSFPIDWLILHFHEIIQPIVGFLLVGTMVYSLRRYYKQVVPAILPKAS
jgi:hypothetical protein